MAQTTLPDSLRYSNTASPDKKSALLFSIGYKMPVNKNIMLNSGHGLYLDLGINAGSYISEKLIMGFYGGWSFKDVLWSTSFNKDFTDQYALSINKELNLSSLDSSIIYSSINLLSSKKGRSPIIPGCEMNSFHNYSFYYGIIIGIKRSYFPIVKLYTGKTGSYFMGSGNIATQDRLYNTFEIKRVMYGMEVMVLRGADHIKKQFQKRNKIITRSALSFYYETGDLFNATLCFADGKQERQIYLKQFTNTSFLNRFRREVNFGFKLSYNLF